MRNILKSFRGLLVISTFCRKFWGFGRMGSVRISAQFAHSKNGSSTVKPARRKRTCISPKPKNCSRRMVLFSKWDKMTNFFRKSDKNRLQNQFSVEIFSVNPKIFKHTNLNWVLNKTREIWLQCFLIFLIYWKIQESMQFLLVLI